LTWATIRRYKEKQAWPDGFWFLSTRDGKAGCRCTALYRFLRELKMLHIHRIEARDLPDLWFQAVYDILDNGRRFTIDRGSFAGQTRLEYDYFTGYIKNPGARPLLPDIPPSCGIPNPVEEAYIYGGEGYDRAYIEYLMTSRKEPGESYTYGERLTKAPLHGDKLYWNDIFFK